jgi:hypothetical protein
MKMRYSIPSIYCVNITQLLEPESIRRILLCVICLHVAACLQIFQGEGRPRRGTRDRAGDSDQQREQGCCNESIEEGSTQGTHGRKAQEQGQGSGDVLLSTSLGA